MPLSKEHHYAGVDFVPQLPKGMQPLLSHFGESRWVLKRPMESPRRSGENRALLPRLITDRNHKIKLLAFEFTQRFGTLSGNINVQFTHHFNRFPPHLRGVRPGGKHVELITSLVPNQLFGDLASG